MIRLLARWRAKRNYIWDLKSSRLGRTRRARRAERPAEAVTCRPAQMLSPRHVAEHPSFAQILCDDADQNDSGDQHAETDQGPRVVFLLGKDVQAFLGHGGYFRFTALYHD